MTDAPPSNAASASLRDRVLRVFESTFNNLPEALARAPGRVNLIGEHTDYNGGFVLPCAIEHHTLVAARRRRDATVRVVACDLSGALDEFRIDLPVERSASSDWRNHVRGMAWAMQQRGVALCGAEMAIAGNVPQGAGLSSSAALSVALGQAWRQMLAGQGAQGIPAPQGAELAGIAQLSENDFVGCQCGIMDPLISACAVPGHALLIDCRDLALRPVALPDGLAVMIVDSKVQRGLVDSAYNLRRRQCEAAARHFAVPALRDLTAEQLVAQRSGLDDSAWRRARHVVSENARTVAAADALAQGDLRRLGQLMAQSHRSMRDDFEITVPAVDHLVEILDGVIAGNGGARMTGGGFGGCVVALLPEPLVKPCGDALARAYRAPDGRAAAVHVSLAAAGAGPA